MMSKENVPFIREHGIVWVELHDNKEKCQELIYRVQHQEEKGIRNLKEKPPEIAFIVRNCTHHAYFHIKSCFRHIVDSARDHAIDEKWRFLLKKEGETDEEVWKLYEDSKKIEKDYWDDIDKNDREFNELKRRQRELEEM